jgi:hypothetical protein
MTLFWLLCLCLVLGGLAFRRAVVDTINGLRLQVFGVRVRVPSPQKLPHPPRSVAPQPARYSLPPPRVRTRPGP